MRQLFYLLLLLAAAPLAAQELYYPPANSSGEWATTSPESLNWNLDSISALYDFLEAEDSRAFLVLKDGRMVLEQYFGTYTQDSIWYWASAGKTLRAALIGIAQQEGFLDINDPTSDYLGNGWTSLEPEQEDSITILNQITMTTGLNPFFSGCTDPACLVYGVPVGTRWYYHNGPYSLTKEVLEAATGTTLNAYTNSKFEAPLQTGFGAWFSADGSTTTYFSSARTMARFGLMIQGGGSWAGTQIMTDTAYFNAMITPSQELNPSYGYLWWLNGQDSYIPPGTFLSIPGPFAPDAPEDVIVAAGADGQLISIAGEDGLIIIRQGGSDDPDNLVPQDLHNEIWRRLNEVRQSPVATEAFSPATSLAINAYPNPASNLIRFTAPEGHYTAQLYASSGRLLRRVENQNYFYVGHLQAGLYRLVVMSDGRRGSEWVRVEGK